MGEYSRAESYFLVEVAFSEPITAELQLWRMDICQIRVKDSERVELSNVVSPNLVCAN